MKKAVFSLKTVAFFVICALFLGACSQGKKEQQTNKLVIWHWMTDRQEAFEELAQVYQAQSGIEIEFKLFFPPDIYSQKVIAAARAGNLPDIFGILGEKKTLASFAKGGYIVNFSNAMQANDSEWKNSFYPQTLATTVFDKNNSYGVNEGIYGVPIDTTVLQFIYNKRLCKKVGLNSDQPPKTFKELISFAKKADKKEGVSGFVCGWGEGWLLNAVATEWAINLMGEEKFLDTIKGKVKYTDPDWIKVFSLFEEIKNAEVLAPGIATMINKEAEDAFSKDKALFSFNGSWSVNVYKQLNKDLDYAFFSLPKVSQEFPVKVWGGAGTSLMVNNKSPMKEEAVKFLKWITAKDQQITLVEKTNNLPAIKGCQEQLSDVLKELMNSFTELTHPNVWPKNEDSRVIEILNRGLQQIVMGLKTPQQIAEEIQKVKERVSR